jgi:mannitol 2-dehydrogenase
MIGFVPVEPDNASLIRQMADPAIRIVSLTVTEGGYFIDPATGDFDAEHPEIRHDAANPERPATAFGAMIAALALRRAKGIQPFTCLSCDNLQGNGTVLRQTVLSLARMSDPGLADWIAETCAFPNSMVDCIVPATGPGEIALAHSFGIADAAPVTHEAFRQWVLEDHFPAGRPPWEAVGATLSTHVHDYETMKIRILNGGHQVIAAPGDLLGLTTVSATMAHPLIGGLLRKVAEGEIVPHVKPTPDMTPRAYLDLIERRFANPEIADTTRRVAFDGSSRQPGFLVPSIQGGLASGVPVDGLALVSALWSRYCEGVREDGSIIEPNDPHWDALQAVARQARTDPGAWLGMERFYGAVGQNARFIDAFSRWRHLLTADGVEATLRTYLVA